MIEEEKIRGYERLEKKYLAAEKNLENNPEICGGKDYIRGFMAGLVEGMVLLAPPSSTVMTLLNERRRELVIAKGQSRRKSLSDYIRGKT